MPNSPYGKITEHAFFHGIDWVEAAEGRLCPPFVPKTVSQPPARLPAFHYNGYFF